MKIRILTAVFVSFFSLTAAAVDFNVNSPLDVADATPGDGVCDTGSGVCTLRAAVMEANALAGADRIVLPAGVYAFAGAHTNEDAAVDGDLDVRDDLTIEGAGSAVTTVNGNGANIGERIFHVLAPTTTFAMSGVEIRNGRASTDGGGIYIAGNIPTTLKDVNVNHNSAANYGGVGSLGPLTMINSFVEDNTAASLAGGVGTSVQTLTLTNTVVDGNEAVAGNGGGLSTDSDLSVTGGSVSHNRSVGLGSEGGGIAILAASSMTLSGVAIEDNESERGGGIFFVDGTAVLENCTVDDNTSTLDDGGGILAFTNASVAVTGGSISGNSAGDDGGAIAADGTLAVTDTVIDGNTAGGDAGGLINLNTAAATTLIRVTVSNNSALNTGGGMEIHGPMTMTDSTVADNSTTATGGGLFVGSPGAVSISRSTIRGNSGLTAGGGVVNVGTGTFEISDSTLSGNEAPSGPGGAIANTGTDLRLTNMTLSGNSAQYGGGINSTGTMTIVNATFFGNEGISGNGANLYNNGPTTIKNSILAGPVSGPNCSGPAATSGGFNIEDTNTCGLAATGDQTDTDPALGPLADNGGPTFTHNPLAGSPAIDKGTDAGAPSTDQRGIARPLDGDGDGTAAFDVGAVEFSHCGDGATGDGEECDDGNASGGDGCSASCAVESGFTCAGSPSVCTAEGGTGGTTGGTAGTGGGTSGSGGCSLIRF